MRVKSQSLFLNNAQITAMVVATVAIMVLAVFVAAPFTAAVIALGHEDAGAKTRGRAYSEGAINPDS